MKFIGKLFKNRLFQIVALAGLVLIAVAKFAPRKWRNKAEDIITK